MTDLPAFSKTDYEFLAEFRYALSQYLRFSRNAVETAGITLQQHQVMLFIIGNPGRQQLTIGELAERLQVRHHSAVGLVDRLEQQGLVERRQNQDDKRRVFINLTKKGISVLQSLAGMHSEELRHLGPQLCAMLKKITHSADSKNAITKRGKCR